MKYPLNTIFFIEYSNGKKSLCKTIKQLFNEYTINTNDNMKYEQFKYIINKDIIIDIKLTSLKDINNYEKYDYKEYLQDKFLEYKKAKKTITNKDEISNRMEYIIYNKLFNEVKQEICN
tara:strand:- start:443 stop:799 length:357 start_codon:yes stop_codon:yes gene_type:complete